MKSWNRHCDPDILCLNGLFEEGVEVAALLESCPAVHIAPHGIVGVVPRGNIGAVLDGEVHPYACWSWSLSCASYLLSSMASETQTLGKAQLHAEQSN